MTSSANNEVLREIARQQRLANQLMKQKFENCPDPELRDWIRGLSYINRLHAKALDLETGLIPVNGYEYTERPKMLEQSAAWLGQMGSGNNPWDKRFAEIDGLCVDHAFFKADGKYHLIYIRLDACTMWQEKSMANFGHAVSEDLLHWEVLEPVLPVRPGTWENTHVWAPHVFWHEGQYWMFYTGVNENACQAISAACSNDLHNWKRVSDEPLIKPGAWGHWDPAAFSNCRDPFVLKTAEGFYCYYTALVGQESKYCVGISFSTDLLHWEDRGYVKLDGSLNTPPESPFVVERDGLFYLFYTSYKDGTVVAVSDRPDGGFVDWPADRYVLLGAVSASEFLQDDDGQWYMTVISHEPNNFHFIEIYRLYWPDSEHETFRVEPIGAS